MHQVVVLNSGFMMLKNKHNVNKKILWKSNLYNVEFMEEGWIKDMEELYKYREEHHDLVAKQISI